MFQLFKRKLLLKKVKQNIRVIAKLITISLFDQINKIMKTKEYKKKKPIVIPLDRTHYN